MQSRVCLGEWDLIAEALQPGWYQVRDLIVGAYSEGRRVAVKILHRPKKSTEWHVKYAAQDGDASRDADATMQAMYSDAIVAVVTNPGDAFDRFIANYREDPRARDRLEAEDDWRLLVEMALGGEPLQQDQLVILGLHDGDPVILARLPEPESA